MTLEEIAALAGVSRATVSRVINNQPRVSDATRQRVQRIIREQGYHPNVAARTLAGHRSQTVGIVMPATMSYTIASPYYALLMEGVTAACDQRGYHLMLSPATAQNPEAYGRLIGGGRLDGLILASVAVGQSFLAWLQESGFPTVLVGLAPEFPQISTVSADYRQGGIMAAQHLIWLGYTRIAVIAGPRQHGAAEARLAGFLDTLREAGIACGADYIAVGEFDEHGGRQGMQQLLTVHPRPEAVFCANDLAAVGALQIIREAGLHVPDDIALIGFDDIPIARTVDPPLTTIRQPIEEIGFTAVSMLIGMLEAQTADPCRKLTPQHVILPTTLIVRDSCGQKQRYEAHRPMIMSQLQATRGG